MGLDDLTILTKLEELDAYSDRRFIAENIIGR
jgi:hypothetical protein